MEEGVLLQGNTAHMRICADRGVLANPLVLLLRSWLYSGINVC